MTTTFAPKIVSTTNDLRNVFGIGSQAIIVNYHSTIGDNGGGTFYWDAASTETDNDGTIVQPTGVSTGRWKRQISGHRIDVRWFGVNASGTNATGTVNTGTNVHNLTSVTGASTNWIGKQIIIEGAGAGGVLVFSTVTNVVGTTVTIAGTFSTNGTFAIFIATGDDTSALQKCFDYVNAQIQTLVDGVAVVGEGGIFTMPTVFLPKGRYSISDTLLLFGSLEADENATILGTDPTKDLLTWYGQTATIRGILFSGGRSAIVDMGHTSGIGDIGSPEANAVLLIDKCTFRYQHGPSVKQYTGSVNFQRAAAKEIIISRFYFEGPHLFMGEYDDAIIGPGFANHNVTGGVPAIMNDQNDLSLGLITFGDTLRVQGLAIAPSGTDHTHSIFVASGTFNLDVRESRLGGESACVGLRIVGGTHKPFTYLGQPITYDAGAGSIHFRDCPLTAFNQQNFIEVWDDFPTRISVRGVEPSSTTDISGNVDAVGCRGVWVSASVDMGAVVLRPKGAMQIDLDGHSALNTSLFRFRQSSDPADITIAQTDLWPQLRQFAVGETFPLANLQYPSDTESRDNLWFADIYNLGQYTFAGSGFGVTGTRDVGGLTLTTYTALSTNQALNFIAMNVDDGSGSHLGWNGGAAGEYCMSMWVLASWSGELLLGFENRILAQRSIIANIPTHVSFPFYHDGYAHKPTVQIYNGPHNATISIGAFSIVAGTIPPLTYTLPIGSTVVVTEPSVPADGDGNASAFRLRSRTQQRQAAPTTGVHLKGEFIWNFAPTSNGPIGFLCTAGGHPGTWAPVAAAGTTSSDGTDLLLAAPAAGGKVKLAVNGLGGTTHVYADQNGLSSTDSGVFNSGGKQAFVGGIGGFLGSFGTITFGVGTAPGLTAFNLMGDTNDSWLNAPNGNSAGVVNIGVGGSGSVKVTVDKYGQQTRTITLFSPAVINDLPGGGAIGTAAATVDNYSYFVVQQNTSGQTLSLPSPTVTAAGKLALVTDSGSASFTMHGATVTNGTSKWFVWNGASWSLT